MINLIDSTQKLEEFCSELKKEPFIAIDLEFLREKNYYADLCLIQVASDSNAAIIDPLAKEINLQPFFEIMQDNKIVKVFHSGRQDIEIIYNLSGKIPSPLFDTQVAAMVFGYGESASYENLVKSILKVDLDKTSRCSNWSIRPLDEKQLSYALSDVTHLVKLYQYFSQKLKETNRQSWIESEIAVLSNPQTYHVDPYEVWRKIKHRSHNAHMLTILRELAAWREVRAQSKNTPRQSIIKDDCLVNIAAMNPQTVEELSQIRNIRKDVINGKLAAEILSVLETCKYISPENYVIPPKEKPLPSGGQSLYELLKLLLKICAQENGVVAKLIASEEELKSFAMQKDEKLPFFSGWRYEIFGKNALDLRDGNLAISYDNEKHSIAFKRNNL